MKLIGKTELEILRQPSLCEIGDLIGKNLFIFFFASRHRFFNWGHLCGVAAQASLLIQLPKKKSSVKLLKNIVSVYLLRNLSKYTSPLPYLSFFPPLGSRDRIPLSQNEKTFLDERFDAGMVMNLGSHFGFCLFIRNSVSSPSYD